MPDVTSEVYTQDSEDQVHEVGPNVRMSNHGPDSDEQQLIKQRLAEPLPTDPQERLLAEQENALPKVQELRSSEEWQEVVAYGYLSESAKKHSLTATSLRGAGLIRRRPLKFFNKEKTECIIIAHLGTNLCGHDGIIHGGLLATLLDEHLAYVTLPSLPNYTGFTANLNVDYRLPVKSNQWVMIRGKLDRVEGRKAWAEAWIGHVEDGTKYTEAKALYISPRMEGPKTNF
ncbi:HotDog domain-containing protein [Halteromyces radiatus]|uniref:HotDog domain-containing protein n=1 Tax=Halteromyces radiatus TaxID=101107 RepID=UPI00221EE24F|nr:HotDog domain-containing protein [Halteromyces radiatus]KAI8077752.1 HotDog domain-containing protein [Halteromyces radiatus]